MRFTKDEPQLAGRVVENVPIKCGTWKAEESLTICEMDDIDVVLGLTFLEAYNGEFKGKTQEVVVQSDGKIERGIWRTSQLHFGKGVE